MKNQLVLTAREREIFDGIVVDTVLGGTYKLEEITEKVIETLKAVKEQWATVLARYHKIKRNVYESLRRAVDRHYLDAGKDRGDNLCTWVPRIEGTKLDRMIIDDVY